MELCDRYLHELINIDPTVNDFFLFEKYLDKKHIQPDIYSEKHYKKLHDLDLKYEKILKDKKNHNIYDKILLRDINYSIHMETEYEIYMYIPINLNENILVDYVTECSGNGSYVFNNKNDFIAFMKRLKVLDTITKEILEKMRNGIKNKVCLPRRTVDRMLETISDIIKNRLYKNDSKNKPVNWEKTVDKHLVDNLKVLRDFLITEYYPSTHEGKLGLCSYRGGKDAYVKNIQQLTFSNIKPDDVIKLGYSELERLINEKKRLEKSMNIKDIDSSVKKYTFEDKKPIFDHLKKIRKKLSKQIFNKYFHGKYLEKDYYKIKSIPLENKRMFAYYVPADLKNKTKGTFYINTFKPNNINKHELYVLSLHEGIPGHHLQITRQNNSEKPSYLKMGDDGYAEGWGLYCENLGDYKDDYEYYYKLQYEILRSLRLVIDPGIHYYGWDYQKCFDVSKKYLTNHTDEEIDKSILRYMNMPGQAVTYKLGEKAFLYVREKLLKKGFDIKDIHEIMLESGPCPLEFFVNLV